VNVATGQVLARRGASIAAEVSAALKLLDHGRPIHGVCQLKLLRRCWEKATWVGKQAMAQNIGTDVEKLRALVESDHPDETPVEW
jgi:hypothetical protein